MLKEKDKIFTNLFGDEPFHLKNAQARGCLLYTSDAADDP